MDLFVAAQFAQQKRCCTRTYLFIRTHISLIALFCWITWVCLRRMYLLLIVKEESEPLWDRSHTLKESHDQNRYAQISHNIKITDRLSEEHWSWLLYNVENLGSCIHADVFWHPNVRHSKPPYGSGSRTVHPSMPPKTAQECEQSVRAWPPLSNPQDWKDLPPTRCITISTGRSSVWSIRSFFLHPSHGCLITFGEFLRPSGWGQQHPHDFQDPRFLRRITNIENFVSFFGTTTK